MKFREAGFHGLTSRHSVPAPMIFGVTLNNNNNNNNIQDNVYGAVIMAEPLIEFTRFI